MAKGKEIERDMDWGDLSNEEIAARVVGNGCRKVILEVDARKLPDDLMPRFQETVHVMRDLYESVISDHDEAGIRRANEVSMCFKYKKGSPGGLVEKTIRSLK